MMKKSISLFVIVIVMVAQQSWAGRAKIATIASDPYISAMVIDGDTGDVLLAENPETPVYPASVIKLMDLLVILERIEQGTNSLDEMVQVTVEAAKTGGSQVYLDTKEQFSIEDLLYALAVQSANDAAVALAIHVGGSKEGFVALMNQKAAELGMTNTHFYSVHGLPPAEGQNVDVTTAGDLALLSRALVSRPDALKYTSTKVRGFRGDAFIMRNHNHLLEQVEGCDGLKTGYFAAAGFSIAATAEREGRRVIAIVMGSNDRKVRDAKASELLAKGFTLLPPKAEITKVVAAPVITKKIEAAEPQPTLALQQETKESTSGGNSWLMFVFGLAVGIVLCGLLIFLKGRKLSAKKNYL